MNHQVRRVELLKRSIPELFDGTLTQQQILYIGAKPGRTQAAPELHAAGHELTLVELVPEFAQALQSDPNFDHVVNGDIAAFLQGLPNDFKYDVSVWWHGPEHVVSDVLNGILDAIESHTRRLVILASPFGRTRLYEFQHPGQTHVNALFPKNYRTLGYETLTLGPKDAGMRGRWSHIMAWKWLEYPSSAEPTTE